MNEYLQQRARLPRCEIKSDDDRDRLLCTNVVSQELILKHIPTSILLALGVWLVEKDKQLNLILVTSDRAHNDQLIVTR